MTICSKCKRPVKGHRKPTGAMCTYKTQITKSKMTDFPPRAHIPSTQPRKEAYFDVERRMMVSCACCGRLHASIECEVIHMYSCVSHSVQVHGNKKIFERVIERLQYLDYIPMGVRHFYDLSHHFGSRYERLSCVPLDWRGVVRNGSECDVLLRFCFECRDSLTKGKGKRPPWAALANGWTTGTFPREFSDVSEAEMKMLVRGTLCFSSLIIAGVKNKILSSHVVTRMAKMGPCEILPRNLDLNDIMVIFSNASPESKDMIKKKWVRCRKILLLKILEWLRMNSPAYRDISPCAAGDSDGDITLDHLVSDEEDDGALLKQVWVAGDRPGAANAVSESHTAYYDLSSDVLLSASNPNGGVIQNLKHYLVRNKAEFADNKHVHFFGSTFIRRFPYGCGTPNSARLTSVTRHKAFQRYLCLADRSYAQDREFVFYMMDELARYKLHLSVHLKIKHNPGIIDDAIAITPEDIAYALKFTSDRRSAAMRGSTMDIELTEGQRSAIRILGVVSKSSESTFGSNEERMKMRRFVDSMYDRFAKPHAMLTFTPKDSTSVWIAFHSGHLNEVSFKTLHNWRDPDFPSQDDIRKAACKDPVLAAIHFQKFLHDYVIPIYFGWDVKNGCSFEGGGEVGILKGWVIPVEQQGALTGTLHAHALLWFEGYPGTSAEEEQDVHYDRKTCEYADSHLIGSFPVLDMFVDKERNGNMKCPVCVDGFLLSEEIPFLCQTSLAAFPPKVAKCLCCQAAFSSNELREKCHELLRRIVYASGVDTSKEQLHIEVKNIISSECLFPLPDVLPRNLPKIKFKYYMNCIIAAIKNITDESVSIPIICNDKAEYILSVLRLDIAIESTHQHRFSVRFYYFDVSCMRLLNLIHCIL